MKHFILILLLSISSCKVAQEQSIHRIDEGRVSRVEHNLQQLEVSWGGDVETLHSWERLDTLGRIVERSTTRQQARSKSKATVQAQSEATTEQALKTTERTRKHTETKGGYSPSLAWLAIAFALGIALSLWIAWRWIRK